MRFRSPHTNYSIVIQREIRSTDEFGDRHVNNPLRARFDGGVCDTIDHQLRFGWSDEERLKVERRLLEHRDFGMPRGFYLDLEHPVPPEFLTANALRPEGCIFTTRDGDETIRCSSEPISQAVPYCQQHAELAFGAKFADAVLVPQGSTLYVCPEPECGGAVIPDGYIEAHRGMHEAAAAIVDGTVLPAPPELVTVGTDQEA